MPTRFHPEKRGLAGLIATSPTGGQRPKGEKRPADVIGAAILVGRIATGEAEDMRRFTRLTNAFSKKFENHCHALALYFYHYNLQRLHKTLRVTPAMAAGISKELLSWETIIELVDQAEQKALVEKRWNVVKKSQID
jgi:hypothetical protein